MYGKGDVHVGKELEGKKRRKVMCLVQKMGVVVELDWGMSSAVIRYHYGGYE